MTRRAGFLCTLVTATVALVTAGGALPAERAAPPSVQSRAIKAALVKLGQNWMFAPFPRSVGRVACRIPSGGIEKPPIPGNCQTRVAVTRGYVTVAFVESWDAAAFSGERGTVTGALSHRWIVIESKRLKPLDVATFGDFPPQWVR